MAEAMSGAELATKADVLAVKADLQTVKADLTREIGLGRSDLTHEIGLVRNDLTREMTAMDSRLPTAILKLGSDTEILRRDMTIRLWTALIASTGISLAAMRVMLAHP
jgi:hypothetical protein